MEDNKLASKMLDFFMWKIENFKKVSILYVQKEDYENSFTQT